VRHEKSGAAQGGAQAVHRNGRHPFGVAKHFEHLFPQGGRGDEIPVGPLQLFGAQAALAGDVLRRQVGHLPQVAAEALQELQTADVDHRLVVFHPEEFEKRLGAFQLPHIVEQAAHDASFHISTAAPERDAVSQ